MELKKVSCVMLVLSIIFLSSLSIVSAMDNSSFGENHNINTIKCPDCQSNDINSTDIFIRGNGDKYNIYLCEDCSNSFIKEKLTSILLTKLLSFNDNNGEVNMFYYHPCPKCGSHDLNYHGHGRYYCENCGNMFRDSDNY